MVVCYNGPARNKLTNIENDITVFLMESNRYTVWTYYNGSNRIKDQFPHMTKNELLDTWEPVNVL